MRIAMGRGRDSPEPGKEEHVRERQLKGVKVEAETLLQPVSTVFGGSNFLFFISLRGKEGGKNKIDFLKKAGRPADR